MKTVGAREVWAVQEITAALARRFDDIPSLWVEAEVQNLRQRGGQVYFTLRDQHQIDASMRSVLFDRLPTAPVDGSLVYAYGRVDFWQDRSQISMRIERLELAGEGALVARIEATKALLSAEGLLSDDRKRPLPMLPRRIALITSAVGAARHDVLNNLWARFPADVVVIDAPVQGVGAPRGLVRALATANSTPGVDVIIVARGGGSLEDLMAFNDESVCRAVAASGVPVVSAVGHEKDVTICDLVADRRVSTPTAAAEVVSVDFSSITARLDAARRDLCRGLVRISDVGTQRADTGTQRLVAGLRGVGARAQIQVTTRARTHEFAVVRLMEDAHRQLPQIGGRLHRSMHDAVAVMDRRVVANAALLDALSPARTLARGYAIVRDPVTDRPLVSVDELRAREAAVVELHDGRVGVHVPKGEK